jgi:hypothetical protein
MPALFRAITAVPERFVVLEGEMIGKGSNPRDRITATHSSTAGRGIPLAGETRPILEPADVAFGLVNLNLCCLPFHVR